ncbi:E3 ubiquitin-protein ligase [Quillaja saponaria]|uniref:RING-type E3 ubiquitin transferase n=1 Tax=Quillaja saponaria TaxID=32244 RepID=A0AAD7P574_QUISA|nr:E3 ubiquitin-protein ligase [Quillaja saponaria]KAJ7976516.1 E3 ubiquitin-protein ligase [Quillaja saponaria]
MEEERLLQSGSVGVSRGNGSIFRGPTIRTTFTLPLTRYTTRLITADRYRIFLGNCFEPQFEDDDDHPIGESSCAYSKPILVLDLIWNLAFVLVAVVVLFSTFDERPSTPLRLWLCGYALQCILHVGFVYFEIGRRFRDYHGAEIGLSLSQNQNSIPKKLESVNTMLSSIWWVFGFYWIVAGGKVLLQDCPRLYWLTVVFLAFDVFFIIFCIGMACIIFFALCCCVPIVAFAYAMSIREGASEEDIRSLPKYRFRHSRLFLFDDDKKQVVRTRMDLGNSNYNTELSLHPEDSECCICLSQYVEGAELYRLPCNHHFHCGCISRWLRTKATCPLCKFNILRGDTLV